MPLGGETREKNRQQEQIYNWQAIEHQKSAAPYNPRALEKNRNQEQIYNGQAIEHQKSVARQSASQTSTSMDEETKQKTPGDWRELTFIRRT